MKVGVYLNTTTGGADYHKQAWVKGFAQGIRAMQSVDYQVDVTDSKKIMPGYDYSFCFSYQSDHYKKTSPMALLRRELIDFHAEDGKIFFMDSDVLISYQKEQFTGSQSKLRETEQGLRYVRVPLGHVHHPHAKHFYKDGWEDRWLEIKKNKGIEVKEYENDPNKPILLVCNRGTEGYGGGGIAAWQWARDTIEELIKHTKRKIIVRFHIANQNDKLEDARKITDFLRDRADLNAGQVSIHTPGKTYPNLLQSIRDSYAVVTYASSAAAPAIIEGRHLFVTSPTCFFYEESAGDLSNIETPKTINRDNFFKRYSHSHWNLLDLRSGDFWRHVKDEIQ